LPDNNTHSCLPAAVCMLLTHLHSLHHL